jgi:hypothetical protein
VVEKERQREGELTDVIRRLRQQLENLERRLADSAPR